MQIRLKSPPENWKLHKESLDAFRLLGNPFDADDLKQKETLVEELFFTLEVTEPAHAHRLYSAWGQEPRASVMLFSGLAASP